MKVGVLEGAGKFGYFSDCEYEMKVTKILIKRYN